MIKKILFLLLFPLAAHGALSESDKAFILNRNLLQNPGFEGSIAKWSASGGPFTLNVTASNIALGAGSGSWDGSASSQTLTSTAVAVPAGLYGRNGEVSCNIMGSGATHLLQAYDGSNVLASTTITSASTFQKTRLNFIFPSTASSVSLRLVTVASNEPTIYVDECYLGEATNLSQVSQASELGTLEYTGTANCVWQVTGGFSSYAADTDCATPTVTGSATAPGTKIPGVVFSNMPPGKYMVVAQGTFGTSDGATNCNFRISDGTNVSPATEVTAVNTTASHIVGSFSYTTAQSSLTFQIQGRVQSGAGSCDIKTNDANQNRDLAFFVYRYPTSAELSYRSDQAPASWSGNHGNGCSWSRTNASFGDPAVDATCTFTQRVNLNFGTVSSYVSGADKLPGVVFTPSRTGRYLVMASGNISGSTGGAGIGVQLYDGSAEISKMGWQVIAANVAQPYTLVGIVNGTAGTALTVSLRTNSSGGSATLGAANETAVEWNLTNLDVNNAAPMLVGSVTSNSTGSERIERAQFSCLSPTSSITSQSGSWVSSVGNRSSATCTVTIANGIFSSTPTCVAVKNSGTAEAFGLVSDSATQLTLTNASAADFAAQIICMGPK